MSFNSNIEEIQNKYNIGKSNNGIVRLQIGDNKVRFVKDSIDFAEHYDTQKKRPFVCIGKDKDCKYCKEGDEPRVQFRAWIINRDEKNEKNKFKILQFPWTVHKEMQKYAKSDDYSFKGVPPYDVTITRTGEGLETEYSVLPDRKDKKLTKEEIEKINELDDLKQMLERQKEKLMDEDDKEEEKIPEIKKSDDDIDVKDIDM